MIEPRFEFSQPGGHRCRRPERRGPVDRWSRGTPNFRSTHSRSGRHCGSRGSTPGTSPPWPSSTVPGLRSWCAGRTDRSSTGSTASSAARRLGLVDPPGHLVRRIGRGRLRRVRALQRRARVAARPRGAPVGGQPHPALAPRALRPERRVGVRRLAQDRRPAARRARPQRAAAGPGASRRSRRPRPARSIPPSCGRASPRSSTRRPEASLRSIAAAVGSSPETVRSVRGKLQAADRGSVERGARGRRHRGHRARPAHPARARRPPARGRPGVQRPGRAAASSSSGSTAPPSTRPTTGPTSGACRGVGSTRWPTKPAVGQRSGATSPTRSKARSVAAP